MGASAYQSPAGNVHDHNLLDLQFLVRLAEFCHNYHNAKSNITMLVVAAQLAQLSHWQHLKPIKPIPRNARRHSKKSRSLDNIAQGSLPIIANQ